MSRLSTSVFVALILFFLAGCGSQGSNMTSTNPNNPQATSVPVSLSITDDPPAGVTVLFFQIDLTAASLAPASGSGSVSLLNGNVPIEVNITQLQAISAFLSTASVPTGTYNSISLTFANPQLVIFNASDSAITGTCPLNTICKLTPQVDNSSSITISSAPFPLVLSPGTPLGFLLDFHLNQVIQPDLSVNLGATNGVTISQFPAMPLPNPTPLGFVIGSVQSVNASQNQFTLQTREGRVFTIDVNSSTTFENFPSTACSTSGFSCLATGEIVDVQVASVQPDNSLLAANVADIQVATQTNVRGDIINLSTTSAGTVMTLLLDFSPDNGTLPFGGMATVTVAGTTTFSVDSGNFTIPSGLNFGSAADLLVGQEVQVNVMQGTLTPGISNAFGPSAVSFTTNSVELEPSQNTGKITAMNSATSTFTLAAAPLLAVQLSPGATPLQVTVETTSQTAFPSLTPNSFSALTPNDVVSVSGWLFSTPSGATAATQVAQTVLVRPDGSF